MATKMFYRIVDYHCQCEECSVSDSEYNHQFSISFIRKGFFEYRTFRRNDEAYSGRILISKPHYEHTIRHIDNQPDITTIFEFDQTFFEELKNHSPELNWFFNNSDIHSILVASTPVLEYLHHNLLTGSTLSHKSIEYNKSQLELDENVVRLVELVMQSLNRSAGVVIPSLPKGMRERHLDTAVKAKEFLLAEFQNDISLQQLASHCCVSIFHFSRIFKLFYQVSPHQYLTKLRMEHANNLLLHSSININSVAMESGFNSTEHFVTAYRQHFGSTPGGVRIQNAEKQDS